MIQENLKISADGFDRKYIQELNQNPRISRIHIGCVESNYNAIEKSEGIKNAVVHILINRIDSIDRLKGKLVEFGVKQILLIYGNPHLHPYKHDFIEVIKQLSQIVDVYVAGYPTWYFNLQNKKHIKRQVEILKKKIDAGAKEIYLQGTYNLHKLRKFKAELIATQLGIPLNFGISPNVSIKNTYAILKDIIVSFTLLFNIKNLDFILRLFKTSNNRTYRFCKRLVKSEIFESNSGIHITTLDSNIIPLLNENLLPEKKLLQSSHKFNFSFPILNIL